MKFTSRMMPLLVASVCAATLFFGCNMPSGKVATVNGKDVSQKTFDTAYRQTLTSMNIDAKSLKAPEMSGVVDFMKKLALENAIMDTLVKTEAEKRKVVVSDEELQQNYKRMVAQSGNEKAMFETLKSMNMTKDDFMQWLKDQMLKNKLAVALAGDKVVVTEGQAQQFYKSHSKMFDQPEQVHARHILVAANPDQMKQDLKSLKAKATPEEIDKQVEKNMTEKMQKAQNLLQQVKMSPQQFEKLAKQNSDDPGSAPKGGDLGYFAREAMVPAFSAAAFGTKPGNIYDKLVQTQFGYHIIEVIDRKPAEKKSFPQVKADLISMLEGQKKQQYLQTWLVEEKKKATIVIDPKYDFNKQAKLVEPGKPIDIPKH